MTNEEFLKAGAKAVGEYGGRFLRKRECAGSVDFTLIANRIRILAIDCKSTDTLSCEFGNEFAPKVEEYLRECFSPNR